MLVTTRDGLTDEGPGYPTVSDRLSGASWTEDPATQLGGVPLLDDVLDLELVGVNGRLSEVHPGRVLVVAVDGVGAPRRRHPAVAPRAVATSTARRAVETVPLVAAFQLDHDQPVTQQHADQRVLARGPRNPAEVVRAETSTCPRKRRFEPPVRQTYSKMA